MLEQEADKPLGAVKDERGGAGSAGLPPWPPAARARVGCAQVLVASLQNVRKGALADESVGLILEGMYLRIKQGGAKKRPVGVALGVKAGGTVELFWPRGSVAFAQTHPRWQREALQRFWERWHAQEPEAIARFQNGLECFCEVQLWPSLLRRKLLTPNLCAELFKPISPRPTPLNPMSKQILTVPSLRRLIRNLDPRGCFGLNGGPTEEL